MPKRNQWECNSQGTILTSNSHRWYSSLTFSNPRMAFNNLCLHITWTTAIMEAITAVITVTILTTKIIMVIMILTTEVIMAVITVQV